MVIVITIKDTRDIIGLKEYIAMKLEDVVEIKRIDVYEEGGDDLSLNVECSPKPSLTATRS